MASAASAPSPAVGGTPASPLSRIARLRGIRPRNGRPSRPAAPVHLLIVPREHIPMLAAARELVLTESGQVFPDSDPVATRVGAAMYTGAMAELVQQFLAGSLGDDLDRVVDEAMATLLPTRAVS